MQVGSVNCHADPNVCRQVQPASSIVFYGADSIPWKNNHSLTSGNLKEIVSQVLVLLPDVLLIAEDQFHVRVYAGRQHDDQRSSPFFSLDVENTFEGELSRETVVGSFC